MFEIRLFGAIEVLQAGEPVTSFRSQKTLTLLAYLIVEDRPLARDYLAGFLWPDVSQSSALGHLRRALYNLTSLLPDCLDVDRRTARFSPQAPAVIDVRQFDELQAQGELGALVKAAELARAPFLQGVYVDDCPEVEAWIASEQERWNRAVTQLLERLIAAHSRRGDDAGALPYARRLTRFDPWREEGYRRLMMLLARAGRRAEALAQYEACRKILQEELNLPVSAETAELYERIRNVPQVRHNLPAEGRPFLGRQQELSEAQQLLSDPHVRLLTVLGPGGIGKTRLARRIAWQLRDHFLEGVWYVNLSGVSRIEALPGAVAAALDLAAGEGADLRTQLLDYLRSRELLLLLDNFEQLVDGRDLLKDILHEAPDVKLLVTSRQALQLYEERLIMLAGFDYPDAAWQKLDRERLLQYAAIRFLTEAVTRYRPQLDVAEYLNAAVTICRLVRGSPLALELAASAARTFSLEHVATAIGQNVDILESTLHNVPQRHRSMRAAIDHSWNLLQEHEQQAFLKLSVFRGGFTLAAFEAVTRLSAGQLQSLIGHSLVQWSGDDRGNDRYEVHELLRRYTLDKLAQQPALAGQVKESHGQFYVAYLAQQGARLDGAEGLVAREQLSAELANVLSAWQWAIEEAHWDHVERGLDGLVRYYRRTGNAGGGLPFLAEALNGLGDRVRNGNGDPKTVSHLRGRLLAARAHLMALAGHFKEGAEAADAALALAQKIEDERVAIEASYALALAHFNQGDRAESRRVAQVALARILQVDLPEFGALLLNMIGRTYLGSDLDAASDHFRRAQETASDIGYLRLGVSTEINLSLVHAAAGRYAAAEERLRQALAQAEQGDYQELLGIIHLNLGTMAYQQGHYDVGEEQYESALGVYRRSGNRSKMGIGYHSRAVVAAEAGRFPAARRYLQQALDLYREVGARQREATILLWLGNVMRALGRYAEARQLLEEGRDLAQTLERKDQWLDACWRLAWLDTEVGDLDGARTQLEQADDLMAETDLVDEHCWTHLAWARYWHYQDNYEQGRRYAAGALDVVRDRNVRLVPECTIRLGHLAADASQWPAAGDYYTEALAMREERKQEHLALEARAGLARTALATGNRALARRQAEEVLSFLETASDPEGVYGSQEPFQTLLTCHRVLQQVDADGDGARHLLRRAHEALRRRANNLDEERRRAFLQDVACHQAIVTAWEAR